MKSVFFCLLLFLFASFQTPADAHAPGQQSFFRINGEVTDFYPIEVDNPSESFLIPEDIAPRPFIVNEPIQFEIDASLLPFPEEVIRETTFHWDFGDGETARGYIHAHAYTEPGTYTLHIEADYGEYATEIEDPTEIQRMFIHVIPSENYELPIATFKANGKSVDPEKKYIEVNLSEEITLDASDSHSINGEIETYEWYLDNGIVKAGKAVTTTYESNPFLANPVLRVTDSNGHITDTQITLKNTHFGNNEPDSPQLLWPLIILGSGGVVILFLFKRKRHRKA